MTARVELHTQWHKSSFSAEDANCVEVAFGAGVRDSKSPDTGHLALRADAYQALVVFARRHDLP
jgi:hypothetical protein